MVERVLPVGEILQTALRRVQNRLAAGKQTVRLLHENRILVVYDALLAEKEKNIHGKKFWIFFSFQIFSQTEGHGNESETLLFLLEDLRFV